MWRNLLCLIAVVLIQVNTKDQRECDPGWSTYPRSRSCYRLITKRLKWSHAEGECLKNKGRLAGISDEYENVFIYDLVNRANLSTPTVWLGRIDKYRGRTVVEWSDGTVGRYTAGFRNGNGDYNGSAQCVTMWLDMERADGSWQVWDCGYTGYAAVCKKSVPGEDPGSAPVSQPSTSTHLSHRCCLKPAHCSLRCAPTERCVPDDLNCLVHECNDTKGWCLPK